MNNGNNIDKTKPLSYKEWGAVLIDLYRQSVDKRQFMIAMRYRGVNINGKNITPIDFFSTSGDLDDNEILEAIEGYLGIQGIESYIENLDNALYHSRKYITDYLLRQLPREITNLEINKVEDIIKIFRKTSTLKPRERQGLGPAYCELIKVIAANFMFEAKELQYLIKETEYVYNKLFATNGDQAQSLHIINKMPSGYDQIVAVQLDDLKLTGSRTVICEGYYRGKSRNSFVTKFLIKPESSITEAVKDGIGLKMEADSKEDIKSLIGIILRELFLRFKIQSVALENTRLFSQQEYAVMQNDIKLFSDKLALRLASMTNIDDTVNADELIKIIRDDNPHSAANFRAIKICDGSISVPLGGVSEAMSINRNFEIQFVLSSNSNEDGFSNHYVYEAKKKLTATTRNLGSFPVSYLDKVALEASQKAGLGYDNVRQHLYNTMLVKITTPKSKAIRLAVSKQTIRLMEAEMFPGSLKLQQIK